MRQIELSDGRLVEWPDEVCDEIQAARRSALVDTAPLHAIRANVVEVESALRMGLPLDQASMADYADRLARSKNLIQDLIRGRSVPASTANHG